MVRLGSMNRSINIFFTLTFPLIVFQTVKLLEQEQNEEKIRLQQLEEKRKLQEAELRRVEEEKERALGLQRKEKELRGETTEQSS